MEKIIYQVSETDGVDWETADFDIAKTALRKGCDVIEHKTFVSYHHKTIVRLYISTELTIDELESEM